MNHIENKIDGIDIDSNGETYKKVRKYKVNLCSILEVYLDYNFFDAIIRRDICNTRV